MTPADLDAIEASLRVTYLAPGIADAFAKLRKERDAMRIVRDDLYRDSLEAGGVLNNAPGLPLVLATPHELDRWEDAIVSLLIIFADAMDDAAYEACVEQVERDQESAQEDRAAERAYERRGY